MEDGARGTKAVSPGIILISSIRLYVPAALPVPGRAEVVLDQGGGAGNERRKIRTVSPLLDSLRCRVLGGRKTQMGKRQRGCSLCVLPCPRPDCRRNQRCFQRRQVARSDVCNHPHLCRLVFLVPSMEDVCHSLGTRSREAAIHPRIEPEACLYQVRVACTTSV